MESRNITIDPQTGSEKGEAETLSAPLESTLQRSPRIKNIRATAMILLFLAVVINYLDRSSLSVTDLTIREELGFTATEVGALLSAFSLVYDIAQLPCGPLLDRKDPRIMLGLDMFPWSLSQAVSGMVCSFTQFVLVRIGMGIDEAPINLCGAKVINDWFNTKECGRLMGFLSAASTIGMAISPPIPAAMVLMMGRCWMFITIGIPGIFVVIGRYTFYRSREDIPLITEEQAYLSAGSVSMHRDPLSFAEWYSLFKNKTMWGIMFGFSDINYIAWLYLAWLPGCLQTAYNLDLESTGFMVVTPFLFDATGTLINGYVTDWLAEGGMAPIKSREIYITAGMLYPAAFTLIVSHVIALIAVVLSVGVVLLYIHFAGTSYWGLIHVAVASRVMTSVGSIQGFASFTCTSFVPMVTGFIIGTTHSFQLALVICGCVTALGVLACTSLVRQPTNDPRND